MTFIVSACSDPMDNPLNINDLSEIREQIANDDNLSNMEKKFVNDQLQEALEWLVLGEYIGEFLTELLGIEAHGDVSDVTFREFISKSLIRYETIKTEKIKIRETNQKINQLVSLVDADVIGFGRNRGILFLNLELNNKFDKDILYVILNYSYIDKYDKVYFRNERVRLTDEVAGNFEGKVEVSVEHIWDSVSRFIWSDVPVRARQSLRDELGEDKADVKVKRDFLMSGLRIETEQIVFTDRSEVRIQNADWQYFED